MLYNTVDDSDFEVDKDKELWIKDCVADKVGVGDGVRVDCVTKRCIAIAGL